MKHMLTSAPRRCAGVVGLSALLVRDTSGDTGLPAVLGGLQLLPAVAGLAAVVLLWRTAARKSL